MKAYAEIQEQIKKLQAQAEEIKAAEIETVIADIKQKIADYDLTAEQLGFTSSSKKTGKKATANNKEAVVMYRKGDLTWSGAARGRKPKWVIEAEATGENLEQYRVK